MEGPTYCGNYEIVKPIGKGKFAVVYNAKRKDTGETVALKRISVNMLDEKARDKCLKEVRLLQSLNHPNIIRYMDSFIDESDLIIIVEWAAAGDLKRQLRKTLEKGSFFEERIIWKYFSQICDAIKNMHERRIMHRDLKPANIFLTLDGTVKVGDLGLSRELSENTLQAHSKVGTPLYMSPEVLRGDGYGFKSDIWSLGCLLYELANLKSPFKSEGLNLYSLFQKISKGEYELLSEKYSEDLRNLSYSMIAIQAEDRPDIEYICTKAAQMRVSTSNTASSQLKGKKKIPESSAQIFKDENENEGDDDVKEQQGNLKERLNIAPLDIREYRFTAANNNKEGNTDNNARFRSPSFRDDEAKTKTTVNERQGVNIKEVADSKLEDTEEVFDQRQLTREMRTTSGHRNNYEKDKPVTQSSTIPHNNNNNSNKYKSATNNNGIVGAGRSNGIGGEELRAEEDDDAPLRRSMSVKPEGAVTDKTAYALATILHTKLEILTCPIQRLCRHLHFACDMGAIGNLPKSIKLRRNQFKLFVDVAFWLFHFIDDSISVKDDDFDSPHVIVKEILLLSQKIGIPLNELSKITPNSMIAGYGISVCTILILLVDKCLHIRKIGEKLPAYDHGDEEAGNGVDAHEDNVEDKDDIIEEEGVQDSERAEEDNQDNTSLDRSNSDQKLTLSRVDNPTVDAAEWRLETERVNAQLIAASKNNLARFGDGWQTHFSALVEHKHKIFSGHNNNYGSSIAIINKEPQHQTATGEEVMHAVNGVHKLTSETNRCIAQLEKVLNNLPNLQILANSYTEYKKVVNELEIRTITINCKISTQSAELVELEEKLDEMTGNLKSKATGDDNDEAGGGSGSVVTIKNALKVLKEQVNDLTLRLELASSMLTRKRLEARSIRTANDRLQRRRRSLVGARGTSSNVKNGQFLDEEDEDNYPFEV